MHFKMNTHKPKFTRLWVNKCGQHVARVFLLGSVVLRFPLGALPGAEVALEFSSFSVDLKTVMQNKISRTTL